MFNILSSHSSRKTMKIASKFVALAALSGFCVALPTVAVAETETSDKSAIISQAKTTTTMNIVEVAVGNDTFSTLVAAVKAADLVEALSAEGPFTVFAPTNEAFAALPAGTVESLLLPENKDKLVEILTYHVIPGKITAEQVKSGQVESLAGKPITFKVKDGKVKVNKATVISADVDASNGVIHVIDQVILPPM